LSHNAMEELGSWRPEDNYTIGETNPDRTMQWRRNRFSSRTEGDVPRTRWPAGWTTPGSAAEL